MKIRQIINAPPGYTAVWENGLERPVVMWALVDRDDGVQLVCPMVMGYVGPYIPEGDHAFREVRYEEDE